MQVTLHHNGRTATIWKVAYTKRENSAYVLHVWFLRSATASRPVKFRLLLGGDGLKVYFYASGFLEDSYIPRDGDTYVRMMWDESDQHILELAGAYSLYGDKGSSSILIAPLIIGEGEQEDAVVTFEAEGRKPMTEV